MLLVFAQIYHVYGIGPSFDRSAFQERLSNTPSGSRYELTRAQQPTPNYNASTPPFLPAPALQPQRLQSVKLPSVEEPVTISWKRGVLLTASQRITHLPLPADKILPPQLPPQSDSVKTDPTGIGQNNSAQ